VLGTSGSISSATSIATLQVLGKADVDGDGDLDDVALQGNKTMPVVISAVNGIGKATFAGDVTFAEILAGYNRGNFTSVRGSLTNAGATIGTVTVDGVFKASSIVAGVDAGGDGKFGTLDDQQLAAAQTPPVNQNLISRIASVILKSVAVDPEEAAGAAFGIVAERVDKVKVGSAFVPLNAGPHNDNFGHDPAPGAPANPFTSTKIRIVEL
jgi:hypothetical protein